MTQQEANALMHHYIGQPSIQSFGSIELGEEKIITGVDIDTMRAGEHSLKIMPLLTASIDIPESILLKIMDMCHMEIWGSVFVYSHTMTTDPEGDGSGLIAIDKEDQQRYGLTIQKRGVEFSCDGNYLNIDQFKYASILLAEGIDLFRWIEAGFARDKKTYQLKAA